MAKTFPSNRPKVRPGSQRPKLPKVFWPANDNIPTKVKSPLVVRGALKTGGRIITRAIPYVGAVLTAYELWKWMNEQAQNWRPHAGWQHVCTITSYCNRGRDINVQYSLNQASTSPVCYNMCNVGAGYSALGTIPHPNHDVVIFGFGFLVQNKYPYLNANQTWFRPGGVTSTFNVATPLPAVAVPPWHVVPPNPGFEELPIGRPSPNPAALPPPYQRPQPGEEPSNKPIPVTDFVAPIMPFPAYVTSPQEIFPYQPIQEIVIKPGGGGGGPPEKPRRPVPGPGVTTPPATGTTPPKPQPQTATEISINIRNPTREDLKDKTPKPREKERKVRSRAVGKLWAFVGQITEGMDLIQVLYDAIPDGKCGKYDWKTRSGDYFTDPYEKAKAIYNCFEHINVGQALENYVNNQIEDWMYAQQGKALGKASGKLGITTGLSRAITQNQQDDFVGYLVPKVDIDWTTGDIAVTVKAINGKPKE